MSLHRPRWRGLLAALAVLVLSTCISGADARTGSPGGRAAVPDSARGVAAADANPAAVGKGQYGIPPIADMDPNTGNPVPYKGTAITDTESSKAKVLIRLPEITTSTYANFCLAFPSGTGDPAFETCCPDPTSTPCIKIDPPTSDYDSQGVNWYAITGPTWVNSPKSTRPAFGLFPEVKVNALAFGSIPVSATVHLNQTVGSDGYYNPLDLDYTFSSVYPVGSRVDGFGVSPPNPIDSGGGNFIYKPAHLDGRVELRLDDLTIDGRPVDVGASCRTASAAALTLGSAGGFSPQPASDTPISYYYGKPGAFTTNPGAQLYGNLDIPRFSGCTNGRENFDPLLTSFVSSKRNPVTVTLTTTLDVCTVDTPGCPQIPTMTPPPQQREAKVAKPSTMSSSATALSAPAVRKNMVRALAALSPRLRNTALASLPLGLRGPVRDGLKRLR